MRDAEAQVGLKHAEALRHADGPAFDVGELDQAAAAFAQAAQAAGCKRHHEQSGVAVEQIIADVVDHHLVVRRADMAPRQVLDAPIGVVAGVDDGASALIETEHRDSGQQHRCRQQEGGGHPEPRLHAEPEIEADAAVGPGHQQRDILDRRHVGAGDPVTEQHLLVVFFVVEQRGRHAYADQVREQQRRNAQAQHQLGDLDGGPAKLPSFVERPDAERGMRECSRRQDDGHRPAAPEQDLVLQNRVHGVGRDVPERMIGEMTDEISEQNNAAKQPDLAHADPTQGTGQGGRRSGSYGFVRHRSGHAGQ